MGKTTLIRCLAGLIIPDAGTITLHGEDITRLPPHERARRGVTTIVQGRGMFPQLTVMENLEMGRIAAGGMSIQDFNKVPDEKKEQLTMFFQTLPVPRQLVSVRPGLEPELVNKLRQRLLGLDDTEEAQLLLNNLNRLNFDLLPVPSQTV